MSTQTASFIETQQSLLNAFENAAQLETPYRNWRLNPVLPMEAARAIGKLPFSPPDIDDTHGRRETHNDSRRFFDQNAIEHFTVCHDVAASMQSPEVIDAIHKRCGLDLQGTYLRIEYAQDTQGFWLEPHTDLGVKKFTMLVYLSEDPEHEDWGTDIYADPEHHVEQVKASFNSAMIFVPSTNTWHGFEPRKINGVRRSLIINFVSDEWRNRHELSFPEQPIPAIDRS